MHGARLHKTSRRDEMVRDPRRTVPRPRGHRDETLVRVETASRPRCQDRDHIAVDTRQRHVMTRPEAAYDDEDEDNSNVAYPLPTYQYIQVDRGRCMSESHQHTWLR